MRNFFARMAPPRRFGWLAAAMAVSLACWTVSIAQASSTEDPNEWQYYHLRLNQLIFEDKEIKEWIESGSWRNNNSWWIDTASLRDPYFEATEDFEALYPGRNAANAWQENAPVIRIKLRRGAEPRGVLVARIKAIDYSNRDQAIPAQRFEFSFDKEAAQSNEPTDILTQLEKASGDRKTRRDYSVEQLREANYWLMRSQHFTDLASGGGPGAPYYRHQSWRSEQAARRALGWETGSDAGSSQNQERWNPQRVAESYDVFTGGRAIRENLQIDRGLEVGQTEGKTVAFSSIEGITTQAMDWGKHLDKDAKTKLDPLASWIPADQHALFFASFGAFSRLIDEARANGSTALQLLEPRAEDAGSQDFYEAQLALPLSELARKMGPLMVSEVAITGSDPYLREGTDIAMLFLCKPGMAVAVEQYILARQAEALGNADDGARSERQHGKAKIVGVSTPLRELSSYVVRVNDAVLVSNSAKQLERCLDAQAEKVESLAGNEDYLFFRQRYPLEGEDSSLMVLTDATIRRWSGPRWRILEHRRASTGAKLNEIVAKGVADRDPHAPPVDFDPLKMTSAMGGEFRVSGSGLAYHTVGGSSNFLTPIVELDIESATKAEAEAYDAFRDRYQTYWQRFFDPIGARVVARPERLSLDTTIAPLIAGSDYQQFVTTTAGPGLSTNAPAPSETALLHFIMQLDPESRSISEVRQLASMFLSGAGPNPMKWIGRHVQVLVERDDKFWSEIAAQKTDRERERFLENNWWRFPIAAEVHVVDVFSLTLFLSALKSLIVTSAPGLLIYENREFEGQPYVVILPDQEQLGNQLDLPEDQEVGIFYIANKNYFFLTLREDLVQDRIKRGKADAARAEKGEASGWAGENLALRVDGDFLPIAFSLFERDLLRTLRQRCHANLRALNEWRRLGASDPVAFHLKTWGVRLLCPAGGEYVWDDENQTMESTALGSPVDPEELVSWQPIPLLGAKRVDAGLTFESEIDGLRARVEVQREPKK